MAPSSVIGATGRGVFPRGTSGDRGLRHGKRPGSPPARRRAGTLPRPTNGGGSLTRLSAGARTRDTQGGGRQMRPTCNARRPHMPPSPSPRIHHTHQAGATPVCPPASGPTSPADPRRPCDIACKRGPCFFDVRKTCANRIDVFLMFV